MVEAVNFPIGWWLALASTLLFPTAWAQDVPQLVEEHDTRVYGLLRDAEIFWLDGTADIFGVGYSSTLSGANTQRFVYSASADSDGNCAIHWRVALPMATQSARSKRLMLSGDSRERSLIAVQSSEDSIHLLSGRDGKATVNIERALLMDHRTLSDGRAGTLYSRSAKVILHTAGREKEFEHNEADGKLIGAAITKTSVGGDCLLIVTEQGGLIRARVIEFSLETNEGARESYLVYEGLARNYLGLNSVISRDDRFAISLRKKKPERNVVILGSLLNPVDRKTIESAPQLPLELEDPSLVARDSLVPPNFGEAICLAPERLVISRPSNPEISAILSWNYHGADYQVARSSVLGENLGTDLQWLRDDTLAICSGGTVSGIFYRNGELRIGRLGKKGKLNTDFVLQEKSLLLAFSRSN